MIFEASAPSNIALIKYMGKRASGNLPSNSSLSLTLDHLRTTVKLEPSKVDEFDDMKNKFSASEKERFLNHLKFLKKEFNFDKCFNVKSENNFPMSSGLASSASSFAALTLAFNEFLNSNGISTDISTLSTLSRRGSGSSCRSFFSPWCLWDHKTGEARAIDLPHYKFIFISVLISGKKKISSSKAHKLVTSSLLYNSRAERVVCRLDEVISCLRNDRWKSLYEVVSAEFWDMMSLFHTSKPSFFYIEPGSLEVLRSVEKIWIDNNSGPLVTMDAGANVHLIFKPEDKSIALDMKDSLNFPYIYHES